MLGFGKSTPCLQRVAASGIYSPWAQCRFLNFQFPLREPLGRFGIGCLGTNEENFRDRFRYRSVVRVVLEGPGGLKCWLLSPVPFRSRLCGTTPDLFPWESSWGLGKGHGGSYLHILRAWNRLAHLVDVNTIPLSAVPRHAPLGSGPFPQENQDSGGDHPVGEEVKRYTE